MERRNFLHASMAALVPASATSASSQDQLRFRAPTRYIDSEHREIQTLVVQIAPSSLEPRERAVRIHDYVRDQIKFGWAADFYDQPASKVLESRVGFCNTKGTLFAAMLRAADIAARQYFVDIDAKILLPFLDPGVPYVDHSFVEVLLDRRWHRTDSYIVDSPLYTVASSRLQAQRKVLGFGIHREGTRDWDGRTDSFSQFVRSPASPVLTTRDYGVLDDIGAFYASGNGVNRLGLLAKLGFGFFARTANQRIEALRGAS
jgi:transglutaminase-like putative cysteine protease